MDLEQQPRSVPAAFGASTPPRNSLMANSNLMTSADDSTIQSKTPPAVPNNTPTPSSHHPNFNPHPSSNPNPYNNSNNNHILNNQLMQSNSSSNINNNSSSTNSASANSQNKKSPSLAKALASSPRGVKRKTSLTPQPTNPASGPGLGIESGQGGNGFGPPLSKATFGSSTSHSSFAGLPMNNGSTDIATMHNNSFASPHYQHQTHVTNAGPTTTNTLNNSCNNNSSVNGKNSSNNLELSRTPSSSDMTSLNAQRQFMPPQQQAPSAPMPNCGPGINNNPNGGNTAQPSSGTTNSNSTSSQPSSTITTTAQQQPPAQQGQTVTSSPSSSSTTTVRLFSTSMLNRAESFISRGICPGGLSAFHANEVCNVKSISPFEDDKIKIDIKLEAQQRYCTNKANTAIANMKALTDSIPTPRSWHSPSSTGSAPGPGGMVSPAASGMPVAPPTMGHMQPPPPTVAGAPQTSVVGGPPVMTGGVDSANGPAGSGISNVNLPSGNIKQEGEMCRSSGSTSTTGTSGSNSQTATSSSQSNGSSNSSQNSSNLSQDLLSKRAIKTEYLKTLKKSLLDDEMHMNDVKQAQQGHMHPMNPAAAMHAHQRMIHPMMAHPPGAPLGMMAHIAGGNQTANAVAQAAANRAAALRQQDYLRQQQQQQHNHANCVQGMCMHQMNAPRELHPAAARQIMALSQHPSAMAGAPPPYLPPGAPPHLAQMHPGNPALRMNAGMHPHNAHMMPKCRPGCNINHVHNVMPGGGPPPGTPGGPGGAMFIPPGMAPMYAQNPRTGAPMMMGPGGMEPPPGMMPAQPMAGPAPGFTGIPNGSNMPMNSNSGPSGVRPMMPYVPGNMVPGATPSNPEGTSPVQGPPGPQYPSNAPTSMASFSQPRMPAPPQPQNAPPPPPPSGGNNSMINVIMTIGSGNGGNSPAMGSMSNQQPPGQMPSTSQVASMGNNYQMQPPPSTNPMMMNSSMPMKQEPTQQHINPQGSQQPPFPGNGNPGMFNGSGPPPPPQDMPQMQGPNVQMNNQMPPYQQSFSNDAVNAGNPDFYPVNQVHQGDPSGPGQPQQPMDPNMMSQPYNSFEMDDINSQNMMNSGGDQRQISVNVDKNMFMVQSNLNGAQFNVQGSALPQGPNLRTNVAVNMQVQSNRYPPNGMANPGPLPPQMGNPYKYGPGFDPAGQGLPPSSIHNPQMWPQMEHPVNIQTAPPPAQLQRAPNFEMYSNLSEFKPISDTPKGTVEYLPDGKTREKSKDNNDFPSSNASNGPTIPQNIHMPADMMPQGAGQSLLMGSEGQPNLNQQQSMMMPVPGQQPAASTGPVFDPNNTFTDFPFPSM
ncbi:uncharacterized protein LOC142344424 isoform X2 [Convolutriloba macropyga]|uniref:uncharacterized protein LOC142344424 isoform X2 n=1 Tax=Convolutriloba macropyga TaxID=536237 RepID=UPI003F51DC1C